MSDQLEHLIRLQEIDNRLSFLNGEAGMIPKKIEAARGVLAEVQKHLSQRQAERDASSQKKREKERDLEDCEAQLSKARNRQSEIKTNKEYQAHLQEIETLKSEKNDVEEALLVLMEQIEDGQRKAEELTRAVKSAEQAFEAERQGLEMRADALKIEMEAVEKEQAAVIPVIEPKLLKMYRHLKNLHRELAVVPIQKGTCGGCHMNVPPQQVAEVKARTRILTCTQCQRMLYWSVSEERPAAINEAGSV